MSDPLHVAAHAALVELWLQLPLRDIGALPLGSDEHVPGTTLHAEQSDVHALLQQKPSTHCPLPHWDALVQAVPSFSAQVARPFRLQALPAEQLVTEQHTPSVQNPETHCPLAAHAVVLVSCGTQFFAALQ